MVVNCVFFIIVEGRELEHGREKCLTDYNIQNKATIFLVLMITPMRDGLRHGFFLQKPPLPSRPTSPVDHEPIVNTSESDVISLDDDESSVRYKMPCGHVIGK